MTRLSPALLLLVLLLAPQPALQADDEPYVEPLPKGAQARLGTLRFRHRERLVNGILALAWSPGGEHIASSANDGDIYLWQARTGRSLRILEGKEWVGALAFSPDSKTLAAGSFDKTVKLWDVASGKVARTLSGHQQRLYAVAFSPDGKQIASLGDSESIRIWDRKSGKETLKIVGEDKYRGVGTRRLAFSRDGALLLGADQETVKLWETGTGKISSRLAGHDSWVWAVAMAPDGKSFASIDDHVLRIWDTATGQALHAIAGHDGLRSVCFSPSGRLIALWSYYDVVLLYDSKTGQRIRSWTRYTVPHENFAGAYSPIAFSPDSKRLALGTNHGTVRILDVVKGTEIHPPEGHESWVWSARFDRAGARLVTTSSDQTVRLWDVAKGREIGTFKGHFDQVFTACFTPDGEHILSANDRSMRLWDIATKKELRRIGEANSHELELLGDGRSVLGVDLDWKTMRHRLQRWDLESGRDLYEGQEGGHAQDVYAVALSPDEKRAATAGLDRVIHLWDVASGREMARLEGHEGHIHTLRFTPDGKTLASAGADETVRLWDFENEKQRRLIKARFEVHALDFSQDGSLLVLAGDKDLQLWDAQGKTRLMRRDNGSAIFTVSFSPDAKTLVSGGTEGTLLLWSVARLKGLKK